MFQGKFLGKFIPLNCKVSYSHTDKLRIFQKCKLIGTLGTRAKK